ncbi:unnamed protein product [Vitrella brassicaformis CCMP3155]|uniref:MD-2-related lipid-recognition domain-containing protein n=1 Tax=Vitrella brassicaformis (strain CCMP3155) TaxID=1169540 RepID=A0A0G4FHN7_VITBC|nr:unnamed protein product [Vitrella brassicaformis CCMP3155]|mmetsp:Transcript_51197/g.128544  ORF Transcript_51197/g.128544 Transcript_51197/m.128544 type:complete len:189 (-) Transcript_51197:1398-1964(-)|eukprot:CEM12983.1 unnamed protein product [Vitrella brassicaformis CCMP3155]
MVLVSFFRWLALGVALAGVAARGEEWSLCPGTTTERFEIGECHIVPDPPVAGEALTVSVTGDLKEEISGGYIEIDLKIDRIIPIHIKEAICDIGDIQCPIAPGHYKRSITREVPPRPKHGKVEGDVKVYDQNNAEVTCVHLSFEIVSPDELEDGVLKNNTTAMDSLPQERAAAILTQRLRHKEEVIIS